MESFITSQEDVPTGHDGSLSTGHANSPADAISRIEVMTLMGAEEMPLKAIRQQVASGIDIIVQLGRLRDKSRRVLEITEVDFIKDGEIQLNPLFRFIEDEKKGKTVNGELKKVGELVHIEKLKAY